MVKRYVASVVAALAAAGALVVAPTTAAQAAPRCSWVCMWEDPNYRGSKYVDTPVETGGVDIDWWNGDNEISSVINNSQYCVVLWSNDTAFEGRHLIIPAHTSIPRLSAYNFDNDAEYFIIDSILC